jgi:hypothetical protein
VKVKWLLCLFERHSVKSEGVWRYKCAFFSSALGSCCCSHSHRPIYFPGKCFPSTYFFWLVIYLSFGRLQPFLTLLQRSWNSVFDSCVHLAENLQSNLLHVLSAAQLLNLFLSIRCFVRMCVRSSFTAWLISGLS